MYLWAFQGLSEWECPDQLVWVRQLPGHPFVYSEPPCNSNKLFNDRTRNISKSTTTSGAVQSGSYSHTIAKILLSVFDGGAWPCAQYCMQHSQIAAWLHSQNTESVPLHA